MKKHYALVLTAVGVIACSERATQAGVVKTEIDLDRLRVASRSAALPSVQTVQLARHCPREYRSYRYRPPRYRHPGSYRGGYYAPPRHRHHYHHHHGYRHRYGRRYGGDGYGGRSFGYDSPGFGLYFRF